MDLATIKAHGYPALTYGNFLTVTLNFLIVAFCVFLLVKVINAARRAVEAEILLLAKKESEGAPAPAPEAAPVPPADVVLLTEIRDLLKQRQG